MRNKQARWIKPMKKKWYFYFDQKGLSLAEILITLVIVGVLTVIGLPHYLKSQRKAMQNEAKTLLAKLYATERTFIGEWGYGTPNFHQLGFFPRGNYFYNAGWETGHTAGGGDSVNQIYSAGLITSMPDYEGPFLPTGSHPYTAFLSLTDFTNVKAVCNDRVFTSAEAPCMFNPTATYDIPDKFGTGTDYEIKIDNTSSPDTVTFGIGATAKFEGAALEDQWHIDQNGRFKNAQIGL